MLNLTPSHFSFERTPPQIIIVYFQPWPAKNASKTWVHDEDLNEKLHLGAQWFNFILESSNFCITKIIIYGRY